MTHCRCGPSSQTTQAPRIAYIASPKVEHPHRANAMAQTFPYVFFSCPCVDTTCPSSRVLKESKRLSQHSQPEEEEGRTFDPRSSRANYALYPLENLLYCEDCHQIRCPRCVSEEVITWFCPSCLFEGSRPQYQIYGCLKTNPSSTQLQHQKRWQQVLFVYSQIKNNTNCFN